MKSKLAAETFDRKIDCHMDNTRHDKSTNTPTVSVVMPVHNGARYIRQAIESVLGQTYDDLELIAIDDASTDETVEIIKAYASPKVRLIQNERNIGHAASANRAIKQSRGVYIARLDADDVSLPRRIERQVDFLEKHPRVGLIGTAAQTIDEEGRVTQDPQTNMGRSGLDLNWRILWHNCMSPHSSAMIRKSALQHVGGYDERFWYAPDYDLWSRLSLEVDLARLPEPLVQWRTHSDGMTSAYSQEKQLAEVRKTIRSGFSQLLGKPVSEEMAWIAREVWSRETADPSVDLDALASFVHAVYDAYVSYHYLRSDKDLGTAKSDTIRTLLAIEQAKRRLTGGKNMRILIRAFRVSPIHCIRSKQFMRQFLHGTFAQVLYRRARRLAHS